MKKTISFCIAVFLSCSTSQQNTSHDTAKAQAPTTVKEGWLDNDTYTVRVMAEDLEKAKDKAQYQILKDIVNVRMLNNSRYTDITKIQLEFEKPLKNGVVIKQQDLSGGIEIWYQIRDDGLKEKFKRK